jgi:Type I restriction enzyme R protein N terminus (HSDR_N)/Eco57I restriction-modification methylase
LPAPSSGYESYSEQDTADKLILPYLTTEFGFPTPSSLDYQAQHTIRTDENTSGRYDGLYLSGGFPYVVMEAKRAGRPLTDDDVTQARSYATGPDFDRPVPFLIVSNGHSHQFYKRTETVDPADGKLKYERIPATGWRAITAEAPGEIRRVLGEGELLDILIGCKEQTFQDISVLFTDPGTGKYDLSRQPKLSPHLKEIIQERRKFVFETAQTDQARLRQAVAAISLHFTTKILFIKLIEDLSVGSDNPRIIHTLFPRREYDLIGGLFGFKVLNSLDRLGENHALQLFAKSKRFYRLMAQDLAKVSWQDIFRYGFSVHSAQYGKLFKAANYDRFLPSEETLATIQTSLIKIDIRSAVLYGDPNARLNVIGRLYEKLIDEQLRNSIGAVYTPDSTMRFMVNLGKAYLTGFRGHKIVEPSCGSGHFYRHIYRAYVNEVLDQQRNQGFPRDPRAAHAEALEHIYARDVDPFAVQLTLLSTFLEQLTDNVRPDKVKNDKRARQWAANKSIDTQNSLDPITIKPDQYWDFDKTLDLTSARSRLDSCKRALLPKLVIGNPPYGVSVVRGDHYDDIYDLSSTDSYGYFIVNALGRLQEGGRVIFIVSSSFLTIISHLKLRSHILANAKIVRIIKLSRHVFQGIDIFPVIIELERCSDKTAREQSFYQFVDLWQLHPTEDEEELKQVYDSILSDRDAERPWPFELSRTARYTVRQGFLDEFSRVPIFGAMPSLYSFMQDVFPTIPPELAFPGIDGQIHRLRAAIVRGRGIVKLSQIASVKIGLQSGDNPSFYRVAAGVIGGAAKGGYKHVDLRNVLTDEGLANLTQDQRAHGIRINDRTAGRYFVPLDKAGKADIDRGLLSQFWRPVEFYVDWSEAAITRMKALPGAVFRNSQHYFRRGVSFSNTGIYSPTFRLSHGGVFDQKGSCIFSDVLSPQTLLGLLSSTLMKYFVKSFINHGVDAQLDDLPIVLPTTEEIILVEGKVREIVAEQQENPAYDYRPRLAELDSIVFDIYRLTSDERTEINTWYKRRYPKLFDESAKQE